MIQKEKKLSSILILIFVLFTINTFSQNLKKVEPKKSNYFVLIEMPICPGVGTVSVAGYDLQNNDNSIGLRIVTGIHDNKTLFFGVGLGFDKYQQATLMPLTLDLRIPFSKKSFTPLVIINAGYSIGIGDVTGGVIIDPSLGIKMDIPNTNAAAFLSMGYKWQQTQFTYTYRNYYNNKVYPRYTADVFLQFFTCNFGVYF